MVVVVELVPPKRWVGSVAFFTPQTKAIYIYILYIYTLEVQRLFFEWFFRKDYCFSRDLQSTIQGDYSFYGRLDFQGIYIYKWYISVAFFLPIGGWTMPPTDPTSTFAPGTSSTTIDFTEVSPLKLWKAKCKDSAKRFGTAA